MSVSDTLDYITLGNPISKAIITSSGALLRSLGLKPKNQVTNLSHSADVPLSAIHQVVIKQVSLADLAGGHYNFVRIGGIGGATAIIMGAYCKYHLRDIEDHKMQIEAQSASDVANRIHFLHSFAMLTMPLANHPVLTGSLMGVGTILFSGSMYYRALTGEKDFQHIATCGGFLLIAAWLSLVL